MRATTQMNVTNSFNVDFELRFHVPLDAEYVISETFFTANLYVYC